MARAPVVRAEAWDGLADSLDLLEEVVESVPSGAGAPRSGRSSPGCGAAIEHGRDDPERRLRDAPDAVRRDRPPSSIASCSRSSRPARTGTRPICSTRFGRRSIGSTSSSGRCGASSTRCSRGSRSTDEPAAHAIDAARRSSGSTRSRTRRRASARRARRDGRASDAQRGELSPELDASAQRLGEALRSAEANADDAASPSSSASPRAPTRRCAGWTSGSSTTRERKLFHIGYNVTIDQVDAHYYDLLASEARLASYLAIVKRDVPESHWYALGRPMTRVARRPGAPVVGRDDVRVPHAEPPDAEPARGRCSPRPCELAVEAQIAYGEQHERAVGHLRVGLRAARRASDLPVSLVRRAGPRLQARPRGGSGRHAVRLDRSPSRSGRARSLDNLSALEAMGMLGTYGLFEALDLHARARDRTARPFAVVRSYMAHHQGMLLVALGNFLNEPIMVERFHADPVVETGELLAQRARARHRAGRMAARRAAPRTRGAAERRRPPRAPAPWSPRGPGRPQAFVLEQRSPHELADRLGRRRSPLAGARAHALRARRHARRRRRVDLPARRRQSARLARDLERRSDDVSRCTRSSSTAATQGISVHVDVAVAPADDVEVRQITLHNETDRAAASHGDERRRSRCSSPRAQAPTHPAFASMFVESERVAELDALLFARRPQVRGGRAAPSSCTASCARAPAVTFAGYETDRAAFFGRGGDRARSAALVTATREPLAAASERSSIPIMSLMARVELEAEGHGDARLRHHGRSLAQRGDRAGADATVRCTPFAGPSATPSRRADDGCSERSSSPSSLPAVQRLFSALLFADPTLRAPPDARRRGAPVQAPPVGARDLRRRPDRARARARPGRAASCARRSRRNATFDRAACVSTSSSSTSRPSGYVSEGAGTLRQRARPGDDADDWLDRHGGIFVVAADQLVRRASAAISRRARASCSTRAMARSRRGWQRVARARRRSCRGSSRRSSDDGATPPRPATRSCSSTTAPAVSPQDGREYVIAVAAGRRRRPRRGATSSRIQSSAASSASRRSARTWSLNSGENRLTPWRNDPVFDTPSEVLYLRDEETAAVWSPTPLPAGRDAQTLVRHGAGYTTYERESHGLEQELTVFVPPDAPLKIVRLRAARTRSRVTGG